jgi:hypothetical protein
LIHRDGVADHALDTEFAHDADAAGGAHGAAQAYLGGPIVAALKASPAVSNISAKLFDVLEGHTAITKGPVK